jgi:cysteine desulfurase
MLNIYLDYAATTPMYPEAVKAMEPYYRELSGNPSASHSYGQRSKAPVGPAHGNASSMLGCAGDEVIFTSSGTESNNTVIKGAAEAQKSIVRCWNPAAFWSNRGTRLVLSRLTVTE